MKVFVTIRAIGFALAMGLAIGAPAARAQVELDMRDADLRSFVQIVSEAVGRNFVLDPQVRGTVTVLAPKGMSTDALYEVFLNVLELNRLTIVEGDETDRIVPLNVARELASGVDPKSGASGYETRVIEVNNVPLSEIIEVVRPLLPSEAVITPVPGANLLILSDRGKNHRRIEALIRRLDMPREVPIEMVHLQNADAAEVLQVVQAMNIIPTGASVTVDRRSNALVVSGPAQLREQVRTLSGRLDTRQNQFSRHVETLNYADAATLADVVLRSFAGFQDESRNPIRIVAEVQTNALLISAPQEQMADVISMIRYLDRRPTQVLVEAVIFEMSVEGFSDLSVEFVTVINNALVGGVQFALDGRTSLTGLISAAASDEAVNPGIGGVIGGGKQNGDSGFFGFLRAVAATTSTRVLATPSIMTLNNQEAEIVVAENVPFVTGSYTSTGDSSNPENPFQTIERRDVGLTLKVTPHINADNTVRMVIEQEVSKLTTATSAAGGEITTRRALSTTVLVRNKNVIMLGGLLEDSSKGQSQRVPGLSNVPLLGGLFRGKNSGKTQRILLIMLRPSVVDSDAEAERLAKEHAASVRQASITLQPTDSGQFPQTPVGAFPFDGNNLNQSFEAGFVDNTAKRKKLPPLPERIQWAGDR
jgi:general secretion pathway protein D